MNIKTIKLFLFMWQYIAIILKYWNKKKSAILYVQIHQNLLLFTRGWYSISNKTYVYLFYPK